MSTSFFMHMLSQPIKKEVKERKKERKKKQLFSKVQNPEIFTFHARSWKMCVLLLLLRNSVALTLLKTCTLFYKLIIARWSTQDHLDCSNFKHACKIKNPKPLDFSANPVIYSDIKCCTEKTLQQCKGDNIKTLYWKMFESIERHWIQMNIN